MLHSRARKPEIGEPTLHLPSVLRCLQQAFAANAEPARESKSRSRKLEIFLANFEGDTRSTRQSWSRYVSQSLARVSPTSGASVRLPRPKSNTSAGISEAIGFLDIRVLSARMNVIVGQ